MAGNGSSYLAMAWAWDLELPTPAQKLVLLCLAGRVDQDFSCFPSLARIARETGLSLSSVKRALNELEHADILQRATRTRTNGAATSTRYYLSHPKASHGEVDEDDDPRRRDELDRASKRAIMARAEPVDNSTASGDG